MIVRCALEQVTLSTGNMRPAQIGPNTTKLRTDASFQAGLSALALLTLVLGNLGWGGPPVHCGNLSSIPGLYILDTDWILVAHPPFVTTKIISRH